jgi:hypothetical protein
MLTKWDEKKYRFGEDGEDHYEWDYEVSFKDKPVHSGCIKGQYDDVPTVMAVLTDWNRSMMNVWFGMIEMVANDRSWK